MRAKANAVSIHAAFRSDATPLEKAVFVTAGDSTPTSCQFLGNATPDAATFAIVPVPGQLVYHIYYMPFTTVRTLLV